MIQLDGYFSIHLSGQRQTSLEKNTGSKSPGTVVYVMHVLFVFSQFLRIRKHRFHTTTCQYMP